MKKFIILFLIGFVFSPIAMAKDMRFIQVSDVRFSGNNNDNVLQKLIKDINKEKNVEFVVFTGDNISKPNKDILIEFVKEVKNLKCPFYIVIGDKDVNKRKDLGKNEYLKVVKKHTAFYKQKTANYVFKNNGVVFMIVDGAKEVVPIPNGYYKDDVLELVDANLDLYKNSNVIILQHFPIIPPIEKEGYNTYKPGKYLEVLNKHNNVKAVVSGHYGVNKEKTVNGITYISTAPAPCYRIIDIIDCDTKNPTIWAQIKE